MESARDEEDAILRSLSPANKLATMNALIQQAYDLKAAWIRSTQPGLGEKEVLARARELVTGGKP